MLTKLTIRNFKRFESVSVELGNPVVFVGPNNSGKTSAMQALSLWNVGVRRWAEKRAGRSPPGKDPVSRSTGGISSRSPFRLPNCSGVICMCAMLQKRMVRREQITFSLLFMLKV
ncbi:MAG: AAA family ATPase [Rhodobacteraceae bacterium]|nr:AAA family ATPase [Paracoccaceae bacterium]